MLSYTIILMIFLGGKGLAIPAKLKQEKALDLISPFNFPKSAARSELMKRLGSSNERAKLSKYDEVKVPQYMLDLFEAVSDSKGIKRKGVLLAGNIVRSFYNEAPRSNLDNIYEFYFNVADISSNETIHKAELRLFKLRIHIQKLKHKRRHHFYRVDIRDQFTGSLIEAKMVSSKGFGWQTFTLTKEVKSWVAHPETNKGFKVIIKGSHKGRSHIRFADEKLINREPILVVFSDTIPDERKKGMKSYREVSTNSARMPRNMHGDTYVDIGEEAPKEFAYFIDYLYAAEVVNEKYQNQNSSHINNTRSRNQETTSTPKDKVMRKLLRKTGTTLYSTGGKTSNTTERPSSTSSSNKGTTKGGKDIFSYFRPMRGSRNYYVDSSTSSSSKLKCQRENMIVDVSKVNWDKWILEPKIFNAYMCTGSCNVYSSQQRGKQTSHATIQAILSMIGNSGDNGIPMPCCAPSELEPMSILFYENVKGTIVVKLESLENMVVKSCACL